MAHRPAPGWLTATTYAHRGLHGPGVPENSLAAAQGAIARGLGIECDIQRSRDGAAMVFHDWELGRLTGAVGMVAEFLADELETLRLLETDEHPVRLEQFMDAIAAQVPLLIEIKSQPGYDVLPTCVEVARVLSGREGQFAVMSFDPRVPQWFAAHVPAICRGLVGTDSLPNGFENVWRNSDSVEQAQPDFLAIDCRDLNQPDAQRWREGGRPLLSWTIRTALQRDIARPQTDALVAEGEALA